MSAALLRVQFRDLAEFPVQFWSLVQASQLHSLPNTKSILSSSSDFALPFLLCTLSFLPCTFLLPFCFLFRFASLPFLVFFALSFLFCLPRSCFLSLPFFLFFLKTSASAARFFCSS